MPPTSPDRVVLTDTQRGDLDRLVRAGRTEQRLAVRAGIVLAAAAGHSNTRIAAGLGICQDTVRKVAAPLVRCTRSVLSGGCAAVRAAAGVQPGADRSGQGGGLHTAEGRWPCTSPGATLPWICASVGSW